MDTVTSRISFEPFTTSSAFAQTLTEEDLRERAPAAFACEAHERTSRAYTFISTRQVLSALAEAGFFPVYARQIRGRTASAQHARHLIRLRRRHETIQLRDAIPEVLLLNSHDGTSAYQLRLGLFRFVCANGLIVSVAAFPAWKMAHRGDVAGEVVRGALELGLHFEQLAACVERMERTELAQPQRLALAAEALTLRFPHEPPSGLRPSQLLEPRRAQDVGTDLWRTFNVIQENILRGGLLRWTATNRLTRTRWISSIREDLRLNPALWDLAMARLA